MFLEPHYKGQRSGWVEVICGSMFSGKTEELIRRLKRAQYAYQSVMVFKPAKDIRYDQNNVVSHDSNVILSTPVNSAEEILLLSDDYSVIGIDEAQFFDMDWQWLNISPRFMLFACIAATLLPILIDSRKIMPKCF